MVLLVRPTLRTVSIMPGMELRAPERTERRRGFSTSPKRAFMIFSTFASAASTSFTSSGGFFLPLA